MSFSKYLLRYVLRSSIAAKRQSQSSSRVVVEEPVNKMGSDQQDAGNNESYKKQLMDQLEKKVEEKSKWPTKLT